MAAKPKKDEAVLLYTTYPSLVEASKAGRALVESRLCACVNIIPGMRSIYRWQGKIEAADEVVMIVKTHAGLAGRVTEAVKRSHPYDEPAVLMLPVTGGSRSYLEWILSESGNEAGSR